MSRLILPYAGSPLPKKEQVGKMFDSIADNYDFLNGILSFGIFKHWQNRLVKEVARGEHKYILDVATGTGSVAIALSALRTESITGVDISDEMLTLGQIKVRQKNLQSVITLKKSDAENLQLADNIFDVVTVAYGVRNFEDLEKGLSEIRRVLRPGGKVVILEFSKPIAPIRPFYHLYSHQIVPMIGKWVTGNSQAYNYLPRSVDAFPSSKRFISILQKTGFQNTACKALTLGIVSLYTGQK